MMRDMRHVLVALLLAVFSVSACQSMGKATGDVAEEVEEGAQEFEEGYEEGTED